MSIEIQEIEKDEVYTVNDKEVYKDSNNNWIARQELTSQEHGAFSQYRATRILSRKLLFKVLHTPGPWEYIPSSLDPKKHSFAVAAEGGSSLIADIYRKSKFFGWGNKKNGIDPEATEANAKLIAAAPDLLAAALKIKSEIDTEGLLQDSYDELLQAIEKATK